MGEELYTRFLDWSRRTSTRVTIKLEDGTVLAEGVRPRSEKEEHDARERARSAASLHGPFTMYSLGLLRRWHGDEAIEAFLATLGAV